MPIYRRRTRRPLRRRPRRMLRRMRMTRKRSLRQSKVHNFKRTYIVEGIQLTTANYKQGYVFKLSDLSNYTEFTNLFDQYRINAVKFQIVPGFNGTDAITQTSLLSIHSAIDHNDVTDPVNVSDLMQYDTYRRTRATRGHKRYFKTNLLTPISDSGGDTTTWGKWVSTENPGAEYYGLKLFIDRPYFVNESNAINFEVYATLYFQCKSVI